MQNSYSKEQVVFAGFWVRLAAYIIDSVIVAAGMLLIRLVLSGVMALVEGSFLGGNLLFSYTLKDIVIYICGVLYFILCTYYTGTTLGKRAMNLRVVSPKEGTKLSFVNVLYRETVGRFLSGFVLAIGYILIGIDGEKRGLHDILADTRVIYAKKVKVIPQTPSAAYNGPRYGQSIPYGACQNPQQGYVPPVAPPVSQGAKPNEVPQEPHAPWEGIKK